MRKVIVIFIIFAFISCRNQREVNDRVEANNNSVNYEVVPEQLAENIRPAPTPGIVALDSFEHYGLLFEHSQIDWEQINAEFPPYQTRRSTIQIDGNRFLFIPDESFFPWDNIAGIYSSSKAEERYSPKNLIDRTWQSWAVSGGIGESFTVEFNIPVRLDGFWIRNGNGQMDRFFQNNRVRSFEIFIDDEEIGKSVTIRDTHEIASYGFPHLFMPEFYPRQVVMNGTYIKASRVTFKITELFCGTQYDKTFIAEIFFVAPTLWGPPGRWGERDQLNSSSHLLGNFTPDPYTISLIRAMYEVYGIPTRLNPDNQLEIYAENWEWDAMWFSPSLNLTGEIVHLHFGGTGGGSSGETYKIFLSPDFPPILITYYWAHDGVFMHNELRKIKLFDGTAWVDHNNNPAILPILTLKDEIEARGLFGRISFNDHNEWGNIIFGNMNSLVLSAHERGGGGELTFNERALETHRFLWNGEVFERQ
ncbi:MAG: hypothetical protein FWC97_03545 [Treponema sp.]|nr:hypothetical protein [Treponema sp.]